MRRALPVVLSTVLLAFCSSIAYGASASIVPAGTMLNVRTTQPIAAEASQPGMTVTGVVDDPVAVVADDVRDGAGGIAHRHELHLVPQRRAILARVADQRIQRRSAVKRIRG